MPKRTEDPRDFHFIIDEELRQRLQHQRIFKDLTGFSGTVVRILKLMYPRLEKEHFSTEQRGSRYGLVAPDLSAKRYSVHVYLPEGLYRRLKLIHQDLNFYSIAQCLRWILSLFLELWERYGVNLEYRLRKLLARWRKQNTAADLPQELIRQLSACGLCRRGRLRLVNLYLPEFSPLAVLRC